MPDHLILLLVCMDLEMWVLNLSINYNLLCIMAAVLVGAARDDSGRKCSIISHS